MFMRYFISVDIDDEGVKQNLMTFMERVKNYGRVNLLDPEHLHVTLLFLGERSSRGVPDMSERFMSATSTLDVGEFTCTIKNVGVFPHMNFIKVVWAGAEPAETFHELHEKFSEGMKVENEHDFVPHVTVGRVKDISGQEKTGLQRLIREWRSEFGAFRVSDVRLKSSELTADGPIYRDVEVATL